jgi:transcriptional regulator GlxA family with amidase domain
MTIVFISLLLPFVGNYVDKRLRRKGRISLILRQHASCRLLRLPDHQIPDLAGPFAAFDAAARLSGWLLYKLETLPRAGGLVAGRGGVREFGPAFRRETGETPAKAVERLRVEAARVRLQEISEPIELIGQAVGFVDREPMRRASVKLPGISLRAIRGLGVMLV